MDGLEFSRRVLVVVLFGVVCVWLPVSGYTLDPNRTITQYLHDYWTTEHGLPQSTVRAITQTPDGYLWLGTQEGLVRFNGMRFQVLNRRNAPFLRNLYVSALWVDDRGGMWIGTYGGGLVYWTPPRARVFTEKDGLKDLVITALTPSHTGGLWIGTANQGVFYLGDGGRIRQFGPEQGLTGHTVHDLFEDHRGRLWVATENGAFVREGTRFRRLGVQDGLPSAVVRAVYEDRRRRMWIGTAEGLVLWEHGARRIFTEADGLASRDVRRLYMDRDGNLWIGTEDNGISRMRPDGTIDSLTPAQGFSGESVYAFYEDHEGSLWIGTLDGGVNRLRSGRFLTYTPGEGLLSNNALTIYEDHSGRLWIGTSAGLQRFHRGRFVEAIATVGDKPIGGVVSLAEVQPGQLWIGTLRGLWIHTRAGLRPVTGLRNTRIRVIFPDTRGRVWVGTSGGLHQLTPSGRVVRVYTRKDGLRSEVIHVVQEGPDGSIWIGTGGGGIHRLREGRIETPPGLGPFDTSIVLALYFDAESVLWIGTFGEGLIRYHQGRVTLYTTDEGLPDNTAFQILEDNEGYLWMSSNRGIYRVARAALNALAQGRVTHIHGRLFGHADGMKNPECNGGHQPAGWKTRDGRLWFPTIAGVVVVDPRRIALGRSPPPPVHIERVVVNFRPFDLFRRPSGTSTFRWGPGVKRIEFHYTGLSFIAPQQMQFRYRLEGFDADWVDAGDQRIAVYTNLPPGRYRFHVIAANPDGIWNQTGDAVTFIVRPHVYQTVAFRLLAAIGLVLIGVGLVYLRLRRMRRRQEHLEHLIQERTRELLEVTRQLEAANRYLEQLSYLDGLTGIPNRRFLDDYLNREWNRALRHERPIALILVDVDFFKHYNDRYGHLQGDECLKRIAHALDTNLKRSADVVGRYGGEEFLVILPETDLDGACVVAERLKQAVESLRIPHEGSGLMPYVTVSIGVSAMVPRTAGDPSILLQLADQALYQAKQSGRNRIDVCVFPSASAP